MKNNDLVIVGIIPARGGSKGLPKKNIKKLCGKPLICYTIETAIKSNLIDKIVVSTDDEETARIASKYNEIDVCMRPYELSIDTASTESALIHACEFLTKNKNIDMDYVLTLEPTSPFRSINTIKETINLLMDDSFDSVVAVTEIKSVLARIKDNHFSHVFPNQPRRRQDREGLYQESSTIYGTSYKKLIEKNLVIGDAPAALLINQSEAFDINDEFDFQIANFMMELKEKIV
jgi:CMP-N-acetylneuraminic acid synthetase